MWSAVTRDPDEKKLSQTLFLQRLIQKMLIFNLVRRIKLKIYIYNNISHTDKNM